MYLHECSYLDETIWTFEASQMLRQAESFFFGFVLANASGTLAKAQSLQKVKSHSSMKTESASKRKRELAAFSAQSNESNPP